MTEIRELPIYRNYLSLDYVHNKQMSNFIPGCRNWNEWTSRRLEFFQKSNFVEHRESYKKKKPCIEEDVTIKSIQSTITYPPESSKKETEQ